ncbi:hypothetical protein TNCV_4803701 [Trichonephila clavipes]|nr:hypothetical protein TNCV_4803701 [Trichonephila clavipes]
MDDRMMELSERAIILALACHPADYYSVLCRVFPVISFGRTSGRLRRKSPPAMCRYRATERSEIKKDMIKNDYDMVPFIFGTSQNLENSRLDHREYDVILPYSIDSIEAAAPLDMDSVQSSVAMEDEWPCLKQLRMNLEYFSIQCLKKGVIV